MFNQGRAVASGLALLCALLTAIPASAADVEAFQIKKKDFKKQVETIALLPVSSPAWMKMPAATAQAIEADISKRLKKKGYELLPPSVYQSIADTMQQQVGGFKQADGSVDEARVAAVNEHAYRELLYQHDVDAILAIRVRQVAAPFYKDKAEWDNAKQKVRHKGRSNVQGNIGATSVELIIFDRQEKLLFLNRGGIELLMWRNQQKFENLPTEELFQEEKRVRKAVDYAMDPF